MEMTTPNPVTTPSGIVRGTLQLLHLRAAQKCTADRDVRYYLNGVIVELHPTAVLLVATDGHRLICCRDVTEAPAFSDCAGPVRFFLENDQITQIIATFGKQQRILPRIAFTFDQATGMVEISGASNIRLTLNGNADTAAAFPAWRRVVPKKTNGTQAQFDPRYLCTCADIAILLNGRKAAPPMRIDHNGESGAVITFGKPHEIVLVLMPYRMETETGWEWVQTERPGEGWRT
jgi:DNA polymerase III subunit beta